MKTEKLAGVGAHIDLNRMCQQLSAADNDALFTDADFDAIEAFANEGVLV